MHSKRLLSIVVGLLAALTAAAPAPSNLLSQRAEQGGDRSVFAHLIVGIVANRKSSADWDLDMKYAKAAGIDAFALNIGPDDYTTKQLDFAYDSAAKNGMKLFISFDFAVFKPASDAATVGALIKRYANKPAQLKVDNKVFVSSFIGDKLDVAAMRKAAGVDVYFAPNFAPGIHGSPADLEGALNWAAWPNDGENHAPKPGKNFTVKMGDDAYTKWLGNKGYIAPVSPWMSTHFGPEVSYSKNWVFPGDLLWYTRWNEILASGPRFIEILTWNDFGESHYTGPLASPHTDDGNSKWVNDMPHTGWLEMAKPFIAAYKAGASSPASYIKEDKLIYWYRPMPKTVNCDSTDNIGAKPTDYDTLSDSVFVVSLLTKEGSVTVSSGKNTKTFKAPAGASAWSVDMGVGPQKFSLQRGGQSVISATSLRDISDKCPCGIYNYNAFVGTVPAGAPDALGPDGLTGFTKGLKDKTCKAEPSLKAGPVKETDAPATMKPTKSVDAPKATTTLATSTSTTTDSGATSTSAPTTSDEPTATETPQKTVEPVETSAAAQSTNSPPVATTAAQQGGSEGCTATVTMSSQIAPTNCLSNGQVWKGPAGQATPDCCDGAKCCK